MKKNALLICSDSDKSQAVSASRIFEIRKRLCSVFEKVIILSFDGKGDINLADIGLSKNLFERYPFTIFMLPYIYYKLARFTRNNSIDIVYISSPYFSAILLLPLFKIVGIRVVSEYRDLPEMLYHNKKYQFNNRFLRGALYFYVKTLEVMVYFFSGFSNLVVGVGDESCAILKKKTKAKNIVNVHNGYNQNDYNNRFKLNDYLYEKNKIIISLVGTIWPMRDTSSLRDFMIVLNKVSKKNNIDVQINHYGSIKTDLTIFINGLDGLKYESSRIDDRESLLNRLSLSSFNLLCCSDDLVWEPTTTVFDYLIAGRPIVKLGNGAKEVDNILKAENRSSYRFNLLNEVDFLNMLNYLNSLDSYDKNDLSGFYLRNNQCEKLDFEDLF